MTASMLPQVKGVWPRMTTLLMQRHDGLLAAMLKPVDRRTSSQASQAGGTGHRERKDVSYRFINNVFRMF